MAPIDSACVINYSTVYIIYVAIGDTVEVVMANVGFLFSIANGHIFMHGCGHVACGLHVFLSAVYVHV